LRDCTLTYVVEKFFLKAVHVHLQSSNHCNVKQM